MKVGQVLFGLAPWLLFSIMTHRLGDNEVAIAGLVAAIVALAMMLYTRGRGGIKLLDAAAVVTFGVIAIVGFAGGRSVDDWLANFGRGGSTLILGALMLLSAVTVPFTEQYARESVPQEYWGTHQFRSTNRAISLAWGLAVVVMGIGHVIAGFVDSSTDPSTGARPADLFLNWILPIVLVLLVIKYTQREAGHARQVSPR